MNNHACNSTQKVENHIHIYKLLFDKPNKQTDHQNSVIVNENEEILLHVFLFIF
jgi:hypothetical protein